MRTSSHLFGLTIQFVGHRSNRSTRELSTICSPSLVLGPRIDLSCYLNGLKVLSFFYTIKKLKQKDSFEMPCSLEPGTQRATCNIVAIHHRQRLSRFINHAVP